ncbi:MAG TPA: caspase family protein [Planctomycetota bacterium]|jgi:hypothetical protein|nr:caspase family protein [Planctomycetota bacterium]
MTQGCSIHVGLNRVDPRHYGGWDGELAGCENDARDMKRIARSRGFRTQLLLTRRATSSAVTAAIAEAAETLRSGDILFLTYSGHGGQVPDENGDEFEDRRDETWVLFDRELVDDELYALLGRFEPGVRVAVLSDSCHSGTVTRARRMAELRASAPMARAFGIDGERRVKALPPDVQERTWRRHRALYSRIQRAHPSGERAAIGASVILISGCQDNQESADGDRNGLFTEKVLEVWSAGRFRGGYRRLHREIGTRMPPVQTPNYYRVGTPSPSFERQKPFTI